jgi:hypothetical protein
MQFFCKLLLTLFFVVGGPVSAHQFTPTYPRFETSFVQGVQQTKMELFNKRQEVWFYELDVYDKDWNKLPFASSQGKLIRIEYLETKIVDVFVKTQDVSKVVYICTESRLLKQDVKGTSVSSKICSKVK